MQGLRAARGGSRMRCAYPGYGTVACRRAKSSRGVAWLPDALRLSGLRSYGPVAFAVSAGASRDAVCSRMRCAYPGYGPVGCRRAKSSRGVAWLPDALRLSGLRPVALVAVRSLCAAWRGSRMRCAYPGYGLRGLRRFALREVRSPDKRSASGAGVRVRRNGRPCWGRKPNPTPANPARRNDGTTSAANRRPVRPNRASTG
jgi:hypothetical protein